MPWIGGVSAGAPSVLPLKLCSTLKDPPVVILNTVPYPTEPPAEVVPYKLRSVPSVRPLLGKAPSFLFWKEYSTVIFPAGESWKTVPKRFPPVCEVLYRLPSRPWARRHSQPGSVGSSLLLPRL